jgi:hypothetical protein
LILWAYLKVKVEYIVRLEEFVNDPAINASSIALDENGTMVLYEAVK